MELQKLLEGLSEELEPIRLLITRFSKDSPTRLGNCHALSHRPRVAPEAYAVCLYEPLPDELIHRYETRFRIHIPPSYRNVLRQVNGVHAFEFSLFGVPPSMAQEPPLLDRVHPQPFDLGTAERHWKREFDVDPALFHFGGGAFSYDENLGYFLDASQNIVAYRKNGDQFGIWTSFRIFLRDELMRAEKDYPQLETFMEETQRRLVQ